MFIIASIARAGMTGVSRSRSSATVHPGAELAAVGVGDAEQREDHLHRQRRREVLHEVAAAARRRARSSRRTAVGADEGLEVGDPPRREGAAHELAQPIVARRVHEDHHRRRSSNMRRVDALDRRALRRAVRLPVAPTPSSTSREARERPEVRARRCGRAARARAASGRSGTDPRGTRTRTGSAPLRSPPGHAFAPQVAKAAALHAADAIEAAVRKWFHLDHSRT